MPTNLKSLLTRSRSKNELKLRESKDEISPAGNSENNISSNNVASVGGGESNSYDDDSNFLCNGKCECSRSSSSEHHHRQVKDDDDDDECCCSCGCCCRQRSESPLYNNSRSSSSSFNINSNSGTTTTTKKAGSYSSPPLQFQQPHNNENDTVVVENNCCFLPPNDLSYNSDSYNSKSDESPSALSSSSCCYSDNDNFMKSFSSSSSATKTPTTVSTSSTSKARATSGGGAALSTMLPPAGGGNSFSHLHHHHQHHHQHHISHPYQCCSQQQQSLGYPYEMVPGTGGAVASGIRDVSPGPLDYCGYYVDEKSNNNVRRSSMLGRMMDGSDNNGEGGEMRLNSSSSRTLFLSCNTLHQQPNNCTITSSYESGHMDTPPLLPPQTSSIGVGEFPSTHASSSLTSSGNVAAAAVLPSLHHNHHHHHQQQQHSQVGPSFRTRSSVSGVATDGCGSLACELPLPSSAVVPSSCCTFNAKDGSPSCQSLSMRKCETVLALSSLNNNNNGNGSISTTASPVITSTSASTNGNKSSSSTSSSSYIRNSLATGFQNYPGGAVPATTVVSSSSGGGGVVPSSGSNVGGKVRVMKEKILSTSSSALNCLLHSSSRTGKLLSGWKLSSGASSTSNGGSSLNVSHMFSGSSEGSNCLGVNCQPNKHYLGVSSSSGAAAVANNDNSNKLGSTRSGGGGGGHHKSRSQLSISENSFSSSPAPLTPVNRLRRNVSVNNTSSFCPTSGGSLSAHSSYSRSSSVSSFVGGGGGWKEKEDPFEQQSLFCRLCLSYVRLEETMEILACSCRYCKDCLISYVSFEITEGADEIACPDASCEKQGVLGMQEVEQLVSPGLIEKHKKFKLFREVEKDNKLMWCPSPGCETVCQIQSGSGILTGGFVPEIDRARGGGGAVSSAVVVAPGVGGGVGAAAAASRSLPFIHCPTCQKTYCSGCKLSWHPDSSCESFRRKLIKQGKLSTEDDELFSLDSIKKCPFCHVPIEKDSGCAQMMCKRCKHVFCWYCLASLDDDFLLRHYDKGPCKNKLGHSRASVVWHRAQVIGIFAGFGVLVLLASPLLILAAPCLLCCRCRYCANKLDPEESDLV